MVKPEESDVELMKLLPGGIEEHLPKDAIKVRASNRGRHIVCCSIREAQRLCGQSEHCSTSGLRGGSGLEGPAVYEQLTKAWSWTT